MSGYLSKKSPKMVLGKHVWQTRFFVIDVRAGHIAYYKDEREPLPQGVIFLDNIRYLVDKKKSEHPGRFNIKLPSDQGSFELRAKTKDVP